MTKSCVFATPFCRSFGILLLGLLIILPLLSTSLVYAQGQYTPAWVPCTADGTILPPNAVDLNGFVVMGGICTGSASGSQSVPFSLTGKNYFYSNPNDWLWNSGTTSLPYDPQADDAMPGIGVNSYNGLYFNEDGPTTPITTSILGQAQLSLHAYFLWKPIPDPDNPPTDPPPPPQPTASFLLRTQLTAFYSNGYQMSASGPTPAGGMTAQASVQDDMFGEKAQVIAPPPPYTYTGGSYSSRDVQTAGGLHLVTVGVQMVGGKGIYTINLSGTTKSQASNSLDATYLPGTAGASATLEGGAKHDNRAVTISCPAVDTYADGGSKYRDPPLTGPVYVDVRQADGTLRGDTVLSSVGGQIFDFTASDYGNWGNNSICHWYSSRTDRSAIYTWVNNVDFSVPEPTIGVSPNSDHINISVTDSGDSAKATGNYYINFHHVYEPASWPADGPAYTVSPIPDLEVPSWPTYPWELPNPALPLYYNDTAGDDISIKPAGFKDVDGGLDLGKDPVVANFGFSYQVEDELTATKHLTATPPVPIGKMTWPVYRPLVNRTKGHLDQYGVHGYISSNNAWRKDEKVGWEIRLYDCQPVGTAVTAPPPNWNP